MTVLSGKFSSVWSVLLARAHLAFLLMNLCVWMWMNLSMPIDYTWDIWESAKPVNIHPEICTYTFTVWMGTSHMCAGKRAVQRGIIGSKMGMCSSTSVVCSTAAAIDDHFRDWNFFVWVLYTQWPSLLQELHGWQRLNKMKLYGSRFAGEKHKYLMICSQSCRRLVTKSYHSQYLCY